MTDVVVTVVIIAGMVGVSKMFVDVIDDACRAWLDRHLSRRS